MVTFVKINSDNNQDIAQQYSVSALPTFLVFRDGKVGDKIQGANPAELKKVVEKLASDIETLGESSSGGQWAGAELPRGYGDITDQVELRGCELLNADEDTGPVKVLFDSSKPKGFDKDTASSKDFVQSGADDQLLLFIPFQSSVKLHTLQVSLHEASSPSGSELTNFSHQDYFTTPSRRGRRPSQTRHHTLIPQPHT